MAMFNSYIGTPPIYGNPHDGWKSKGQLGKELLRTAHQDDGLPARRPNVQMEVPPKCR